MVPAGGTSFVARSGTSLMNQASTGTATVKTTAQKKTCEMASDRPPSTASRIGPVSFLSASRSIAPPSPPEPANAAPAAESARRLAKIAPKRETPNEPPMDRKKVAAPLAAPRSFCSTLFCAISIEVCMRKPMPTPSTTM